MTTITLLAENRILASALTGFMDAFAIANMLWMFSEGKEAPLFKTEIVTVDGQDVTAHGGFLIRPDKSIHDVQETDIIIVPAFFLPIDLKNPGFIPICEWLTSHHNKGTPIASSCTGTFLLAHANLLNGRLATTNWQLAGLFRKKYPEVNLLIDRIYTEDCGIYCTGAATAFMDLCLHFIAKFGSAELAGKCAKALLVDPDRNSQAPYITHDFRKMHSDDAILKSQVWMEENFSSQITIDQIADNAGISPRHFKRRFKSATGETPLGYLQMLRIEKAKERLETTGDSINEITWQVGYEDINSFRKLFKTHAGMSPKEYRSKFSRNAGTKASRL